MTQNPVIEDLVKGAVERCRERIAAAQESGAVRKGRETTRSGITGSMKLSHGL